MMACLHTFSVCNSVSQDFLWVLRHNVDLLIYMIKKNFNEIWGVKKLLVLLLLIYWEDWCCRRSGQLEKQPGSSFCFHHSLAGDNYGAWSLLDCMCLHFHWNTVVAFKCSGVFFLALRAFMRYVCTLPMIAVKCKKKKNQATLAWCFVFDSFELSNWY